MLYEKDNAGIKNLTSYFHNIPNGILELLVQKGVFPYSYHDSFNKLESIEYPDYESFNDNLKDKNIDIKEYERGKKLWDYFKCKNFREYMELYLTCDVLILADCFESFRDLSVGFRLCRQRKSLSEKSLTARLKSPNTFSTF